MNMQHMIQYGKHPWKKNSACSRRTTLGNWLIFPPGRKLVQCKWVFKTKFAADGSPLKYKARFVSKIYSQVHGIDYNETFSPVLKMDSIRIALAIAASKQWEVHHMDVKCVFLNGDLTEEIYM